MNTQLLALRNILQANRGNVLTDELCIGIEAVFGHRLTEQPDAAVAHLFPPEEHAGVVFRAERVVDIADEILPLYQAHWEESEAYRHGLPFCPGFELWASEEKAGRFILFTARKDGVLLGYCQAYVSVSAHTGTKICTEDALYLDPEIRKGLTCKRLVQYAERSVKLLGVREVRMTVKVTNDIWKLWERAGYAKTGYELVKVLED